MRTSTIFRTKQLWCVYSVVARVVWDVGSRVFRKEGKSALSTRLLRAVVAIRHYKFVGNGSLNALSPVMVVEVVSAHWFVLRAPVFRRMSILFPCKARVVVGVALVFLARASLFGLPIVPTGCHAQTRIVGCAVNISRVVYCSMEIRAQDGLVKVGYLMEVGGSSTTVHTKLHSRGTRIKPIPSVDDIGKNLVGKLLGPRFHNVSIVAVDAKVLHRGLLGRSAR